MTQRNTIPTTDYDMILKQLQALTEGETDQITILANASALLNQFLEQINWVGFYLWDQDDKLLKLGPFQGLPTCTTIAYGKGVCGTALKSMSTQRVPDVEQFPGHIVCDAASRSEIVIPIKVHGKPYGVLDIDSPILNRFDERDEKYLEQFVEILVDHLSSIV